jgi:regulator of sigma E protease
MADILQNVLALILTLGILVTIHEFGHFWVARRCGVKVLRFSVGFGRSLFAWKDRQGTEYVIAALPLGGYVKMLDEREGPVESHELALAFNRQPVGRRMAIAAAGPLSNFLFAILAYACMFGIGVNTVVPVVGKIIAESPAADTNLEPGMQILAVDGKTVAGWADVNMALVQRVGESGTLTLTVQTEGASTTTSRVEVPLRDWLTGQVAPDLIAGLGLVPWRPPVIPEIREIVANSPAAEAGLRAGDVILGVDGVLTPDWHDFVEIVAASPGQALELDIRRDGLRLTRNLTPETRETDQGLQGFAGISVVRPVWPESMRRVVQKGPIDAVVAGVDRTADMTLMILGSLKKMLSGLISVENLGGPITIAKAAGASAEYGVESFLTFLAQLSVMLAVLNLLPIPVLDGGHLLYYTIEWVRGKPLSEAGQVLGLKIGMAILAGIMALALFNDFARL